MGNPEVEGLKAEIARLRKENDAQRKMIDDLVKAMLSAQRLSAELTKSLTVQQSKPGG